MDMPSGSPDGKTLTIQIHPHVVFQKDPAFSELKDQKRTLKAEDFVYGIKRLAFLRPKSLLVDLLKRRLLGFSEFIDKIQSVQKSEVKALLRAEKIAGLVAKDDTSLVLKLLTPDAEILHLFAHPQTAPVAHEVAPLYLGSEALDKEPSSEKAEKKKNPSKNGPLRGISFVGTGPFELDSLRVGDEIVLKKNKLYHTEFFPPESENTLGKHGAKPLPIIDYVVFRHLKLDTPELAYFKKGKLRYDR